MRDTLRNKCELFADNYLILRKKLKWGYTINNKLGSLLYTMENRSVDTEAISRCRKIIKSNTGIFSQFKDVTLLMTSVMLSLNPEPERILKDAVSIYHAMKEEGLHSSSYLVLAALSVAISSSQEHYERIITLTRSFYKAMKEEHRFLTSSDDYGFAALLAISDKPVESTIREMEECYRILKQDFSNSNAVQTLSQILTYSEENVPSKCKRVVDLYQTLKWKGCKPGKGVEMSFLGVVAILQKDTQMLAEEIAEVHYLLKGKKGFGFWSASARERTMFAAALVCDDYLEDKKRDTMELTLANNITGILLAQQAAAIAAASAAAAASATSAT